MLYVNTNILLPLAIHFPCHLSDQQRSVTSMCSSDHLSSLFLLIERDVRMLFFDLHLCVPSPPNLKSYLPLDILLIYLSIVLLVVT